MLCRTVPAACWEEWWQWADVFRAVRVSPMQTEPDLEPCCLQVGESPGLLGQEFWVHFFLPHRRVCREGGWSHCGQACPLVWSSRTGSRNPHEHELGPGLRSTLLNTSTGCVSFPGILRGPWGSLALNKEEESSFETVYFLCLG